MKIEYEVDGPAEFSGPTGSFSGNFKVTNLTRLNTRDISVVVTVNEMNRFWNTSVVNHHPEDEDDRTLRIPNLGPYQSQKNPVSFRWTVS
ncbi:MAG: hypothetical protein GY859_43660 [Desulfobacterales bacterium]|nr:hypothetical protein [Desulfobacterales bacterium]